MGFWIFMFCMNLLIPIVMVIFGLVFLRKPPKDINDFYGYRTKRSKASKEAWDFAHKYMGRLWLWVGIALAIVTVLLMLSCLGKDVDYVGLYGGVVCLVECVVMILPIVPTEQALKKQFGR